MTTTTGATHAASGSVKGDFVKAGGATVATGTGRSSATVTSFGWGYGTVTAATISTTCSNGRATVTIAGASPSALNGTYTAAKTVTFTGGTATAHATYAKGSAAGAYGLLIRARVRQRPGRRCHL